MTPSNPTESAPGTVRDAAEGRETYDVHAVQDKWLPVWDAIAPFRAGRADDMRPKKY
ncbi:MAG: hypothetical protein F2911_07235, partial [Actinobacteria bacterium]|nr:hypothetical protein [Actinomycetota bacterium]MSW36713.1 hypothetical protein [Actinomycetota bacterium]MSX38161.1 hypothetical protein [Actinomycetota bacterium]